MKKQKKKRRTKRKSKRKKTQEIKRCENKRAMQFHKNAF